MLEGGDHRQIMAKRHDPFCAHAFCGPEGKVIPIVERQGKTGWSMHLRFVSVDPSQHCASECKIFGLVLM